MHKHNSKPAGRASTLLFAGFLAVFLLGVVLNIGFLFFQYNTNFVIGTTGFVQEMIWRVILSVVAAVIFIVCLAKSKKASSLLAVFGYVAGAIGCAVFSFFLLRALVQDIPYLSRPETTYLNHLEFDSSTIGDGPASYYVQGMGIDGERHSFDIGRKTYTEGREMWYENFDLRAKIKYLPHTGVVMSVDFLDSIDDEAYRLYPSLLSDDWHSFSIQICNQVYSVPTPLSTFLEAGWTMEEEYAGRQLQGADEPYESYDDISVWLTNENGQKISVSVCNTSKNAIDITQGTVGYLHVIYGNLDFSGADLQIPGGLMLGWSTKEDIAALYGRPYEAVNDRLYTYQEEGSGTSYYRLGFSEEGFLEDIAIRNLPYGREQ